MRIELPKTEYPFIRLIINYSGGEFDTTVSGSDSEAIIDLPEGLTEDEVEVMAIFCDADMKEPEEVWTKMLKTAPNWDKQLDD